MTKSTELSAFSGSSAYEAFAEQQKDAPWLAEYKMLRLEGWSWKKAAFIAWAASPKARRWPETQEKLAELLGLKSDRTFRGWKRRDPLIEERIARMQVEGLFAYRRDVINTLIQMAITADPKCHQDRQMFLEMTGDYTPKGKIDLGGALGIGGTGMGDVTDDELAAIEGALRKAATGGGTA